MHSYREEIVGVAAHEFMHLAGETGRRDGEMMCETASLHAIKAYRENQARVDSQIEDRLRKKAEREARGREAAATKKAERNSPSAKLSRLEEQRKRWTRKLKTAETKIKKLNRRIAAMKAWEERGQAGA